MKIFFSILFALLGIVNAQWLLPDIYLPDSLSGLTDVSVLCTGNNKIYVGGLDSWLIVISGATNQKIAKISIPGVVTQGYLCYNAINNKVYLGLYYRNKVVVVDGLADTIIKIINVKDSITGVIYDSAFNRVYVSHYYDTVTVINGTNDSVIAKIGVNRGAKVLGCNYSGSKIYVGNQSSPYSISVISAPGNFVIKNIPFQEWPYNFCYNSTNNKAYIGFVNFVVIDGIGDSIIKTINNVGGQCSIVYNWLNNCIYACKVTGASRDTVTVIDGYSDTVIAKIVVYNNPEALTFNPRDNKVYCPNRSSNNISIINCATNTVIATINTEPYPRPVIYNPINNRVYCGNSRGPSVTVIDGTNNSRVGIVRVGSYLTTMVYNTVSKKVYCTEFQWAAQGLYFPGFIHVINGNNNKPITSVTVGYRPMALTYNPTNNKVYCSNYYSGTVSVINGASDSIIANVAVGSYPNGLCYNSVNNRIYCAIEGNDNVKVIDGSTNSVIATVPTGNKPWKLFYHSGRNKIYSIDSTTITVIDGASNTQIKIIPTTNGFSGFCYGYNSQHDKLYIGEMYIAGISFFGAIDVIDCSTDSIIKWIYVGPQVRDICYNYINDKFYASIGTTSGSGNGTVEIYNGTNDSLLKTINLNSFPTPIFYNPTNNKIFCGTNREIVVIDGNTDNIITTFNQPASEALCYNPAKNYLYCSSMSSRLTVLADEMVWVEKENIFNTINFLSVAPNPFNCQTKIKFKVTQGETVRIKIYNVSGTCVKNLLYSAVTNGTCELIWDGTDDCNRKLSSGIYFLKADTKGNANGKKVILIR